MNDTPDYEAQAETQQARARIERLHLALRTIATYAEGRQHAHAALHEVADADAAIGFSRVLTIANAALETR